MPRTAAFALATWIALSPAGAVEVGSYSLGNWTISVHNDDSAFFASCVGSVSYRSGITMAVQIDRNFTWNLGFGSDAWKFQPRERISIRYRFDGSNWYGGIAEAISANMVTVPMPSDGEVATMFRRGRTMDISDGHWSSSFDLSGTSRLLAELVSCVESRLSSEQAIAATGPLPTATPDPAALQLEGTRVLSNFLFEADVRGAKLAPTDGSGEQMEFAHAIALTDGLIAFVHVVPNANASSEYLSAEMAARISEGCTGKFGTGSTKENVEGVVLVNGFAACKLETDSTYVQYVVVERNPHGRYIIGLLFSGNANAAADAAPVEKARLLNAAFRASR